MNLIIEPDGRVRGLYSEEIDLATLGRTRISPASHVEPNEGGVVDLAPVGGPVLGPFDRRSEVLATEVVWLEANLLGG